MTIDTSLGENSRPSPAEQWRSGISYSSIPDWLGDPLRDRHHLREGEISERALLDTSPIPETSFRQGYFDDDDLGFWLFGLLDFLEVKEACRAHGVLPRRVLDLGCSSGRVLRHWLIDGTPSQLWGTDLDPRELTWATKNLGPSLQLFQGTPAPSIPLPAASLDLVTAFSVFTHLDTLELPWLLELLRVLDDDGLLYLTVHTEHTWDWIQQCPEESEHIRSHMSKIAADDNCLDLPHLPDRRFVIKRSDRYDEGCHVFHSVDYLQDVWGRFVDIAEIRPFASAQQTVLILKKKAV